MKKTLKTLLIAAFMVVILLALTGCGNKLVATRETEEDGIKVEEKIEVSFKKDKVNKVKMTYEFDKKETAEFMAGMFKMTMSSIGADVKQSGKKVVMSLDAKTYAKMANEDEQEISKDKLKETLQDEGYKVK